MLSCHRAQAETERERERESSASPACNSHLLHQLETSTGAHHCMYWLHAFCASKMTGSLCRCTASMTRCTASMTSVLHTTRKLSTTWIAFETGVLRAARKHDQECRPCSVSPFSSNCAHRLRHPHTIIMHALRNIIRSQRFAHAETLLAANEGPIGRSASGSLCSTSYSSSALGSQAETQHAHRWPWPAACVSFA